MLQIGARRDGCVGFQNWHPSRVATLTNHRWFWTVKRFARMTSTPCSDWIKAMGEHTVKYVCVAKTKCAFASVSLSSACRHESPSHLLFHSFGMQFISPVTNSFLFFYPSLQPTPPSLHLPLIISLHLSPLHSLDERNGGTEELERERERRIQP